MIAESLFWEEMATHVRGLKAEFAGSAFGAARTMEGDGARALEASLRKFTEEVPAGQELPAFEQIGKYLLEVSENLRKIAIQVETTKVTILGMASWLVAQLAIAAASLIWSLGTTTLFVAGVWAAIRAAVPLVLRQLLISILTGALMMGGINAVAQVVGFAKGTRRDFGAENWAELGINVAMGAIGGAIGFGVGKVFTAGVTKVFGAKAAQSFAASVVGGVVNNAVTSVAMIPVAEQITGAKGGHLTWETFTSGAAFGAAGHAMNAAKQTTVLKVNPAKVPKIFNNSVLKLKTNFDGGPGGGGVPRGGGAPNTGGGVGEKPKFGDNASTTSTDSSSSSGSDGPGGDMGITVMKDTVVTNEPSGPGNTRSETVVRSTSDTVTDTSDGIAWPAVPTHRPERISEPAAVPSAPEAGAGGQSVADVLSGPNQQPPQAPQTTQTSQSPQAPQTTQTSQTSQTLQSARPMEPGASARSGVSETVAVPKAVTSVRAPSIDTVVSGPNQGSAGSTVRPHSGEGMPKASSPVSASSVAGRPENLTVGAEATASPGGTPKAAAELPGSAQYQGHRRTDSGFGGDIFDGKESGPAQGGGVETPFGELPPESGHAPDGGASESSVMSGLDAGLRARLEALREGDPGPRVGLEGVVSSAEVEARALAAGMSPGEWSSYVRRYEAALGKGDFEAAGVILEQRGVHVAELEAGGRDGQKASEPEEQVEAGSGGSVSDLSDLQDRLDRLQGGAKSSGVVVGEDLLGGQGGLAPERVEELLAGAPAVPGSGDVVGAREAAVLESLVVRARTAGMSVQEIAGWQERFVQAWEGAPEAHSGFGELARQWHQELDGLSGGSSRPGVEELFASAPAKAESAQEVLARAAEDAGVPLVEHASWMERIREAWGQGRGEDA
ncbi:hypothetical protein AB0C77_15935, partial [Streptomyces sp. NPDC048629]|uniref:hypothetical protein n=1 Tax=Streptomyces sp. NPDC048629 TaxID=3154824 RepID=UPI00342E0894